MKYRYALRRHHSHQSDLIVYRDDIMISLNHAAGTKFFGERVRLKKLLGKITKTRKIHEFAIRNILKTFWQSSPLPNSFFSDAGTLSCLIEIM